MNAELQINEKLPVLAFNFEQLKAWATEIAERYASIAVTEDAIADVKRDMAEINKAKKAVDDARKEAVCRVSEPIRSFESQIKEVCSIFDAAYSKLGEQVKAFEDAQREERRLKVEAIIQGRLSHEGADIQIPMREKWLNKSTSAATIKAEISEILARHHEEEHRKRELEQAKQDRAAAIENHVRTLNERYGLNLPVSRFLVHMGTFSSASLADVLADIEKSYAVIMHQHKAEQAKQEQPRTAEPDVSASQGPAQTRAMSVVFEFETQFQHRIAEHLEAIKRMCISFHARSK